MSNPDEPRVLVAVPVVPDPSLWARIQAVLYGLAAVVAYFFGAAAALLSALVGKPPAPALGRVIADEYRRGYHRAQDADLIDEQDGAGL